MSTEQDLIERLCEHIGIEAWPRLKLLCEQFAVEFKCDVYVFGSAMRTKDWRDIDITLCFDYNRWCQITQAGYGPNAWAVLSSALTMYATAIVGHHVEVHYAGQEMKQNPNLHLGKKPSG